EPKPMVTLQGQRVSPGFNVLEVTPEDLLTTFFNLPTDQLIRVQQSLIDIGIKGLKANGKLDTKGQIDAYTKGIKSTADSYSTLIENTPETLLNKVPGTLETFLQKSAAEKKGEGPSVYDTIYLTSPEDAVSDFNQTSVDLLGVAADQKDAEEYARRLKQLEQKSFQRQTTKTVGGRQVSTVIKGGVTEDEKTKLALDILGKKITVENVDNVGGAIGSNLNRLSKYASDYGLALSKADLLKYSLNAVTSKTGIDDAVIKFKNLAKGYFPALSNLIDQDISPREFLSPFIQLKSQIFGTPTSGIDITRDQDLITAMSGDKIPSLYDFGIKLRSKPEYQYTPQARQDASQYALKILSDFGLA
ncbi:MAG TPA: hypothetical protein PLI52_02840, partial [Prochlorococcaceae cyanobacterium AMR_MDS_5431]|nr:hypothetical protein [Prochlorococcaceae cyanobacterium AMR_MDS_5431]